MDQIREKAKKLFNGSCKVCPICNGKACAGQLPGMGGAGTGGSFHSNFEALAKVKFNMSLIHDVVEPDTSVQLMNHQLSLPVMAAPIGGISYNMNSAISEKDYITAIVEGCKAAGTIGCTGDGVPDVISQEGFAAMKNSGGIAIPFIKPWEDEELYRKLAEAKDAGAKIIGMDIDAAGLVTLRLMGRPVSPKTPAKLAEIVKESGCKFILKGVMSTQDAKFALEAGVDAIMVSDHGGRVFDHTPGTAEVLPEIAEVVDGKATIFVDGGVRTGSDVLKMLALGADCVMIGRPFSIAAVGGLQEGVEKYIAKLTTELKQAMVLTGTSDLSNVNPNIIRK
ncbi:MAG: alpha-hydroxy-acid oxidizing protein [Desulfotalea sp.]